MHPPLGPIEVSITELETLLEQARQEPLEEDGYQKLRDAIRTLGRVTALLERQETTWLSCATNLCPASTEKTTKVLERAGIDSGEKKPAHRKLVAGHGRNGAAAYGGARRTQAPHEFLKSGDPCPGGCGGKVYPQRDPGLRVRVHGGANHDDRLRVGPAGVQSVRRRLHRRRTARCGREKVR